MSSRPNTTETSRIGIRHSDLRAERLTLANSTITFETGPIGTIARVDHADGRRDYAGPLGEGTIEALWEVSR